MSNSFFQFKQFIIHQDKCALKVCTDACLFGAYVAEEIAVVKKDKACCLDIGTGTGLLSLMIAQKNTIAIDAVEIDEDAHIQAGNNSCSAVFDNKIAFYQQNILEFYPPGKYDFIVSNPPFYENQLSSPEVKKNMAKHDVSLTSMELLETAHRLIKDEGIFFVLLPFQRLNSFENEALKLGFHLSKRIMIRQTPNHPPFRGILHFTKKHLPIATTGIIIKNSEGTYSDEFTSLLKSYYLYLQ